MATNGNGGPWGQKPPSSNGGGNNNGGKPTPPPEIEQLIKKSKEMFGNGGGGNIGGKKPMFLIGFVILVIWLVSGSWYTIDDKEEGVIMRFGAFHRIAGPGFHLKMPNPVERLLKVPVQSVNGLEIGVRSTGSGRSGKKIKVLEESLMLTVDENISDVSFQVQWKISKANEYLFNLKDPENTIKSVAESAMREVVGQTTAEQVLTTGKSEIQRHAKEILQNVLDEYKAGVEILSVQLLDVEVPSAVIAAYKDVQNAKIDLESAINQAEAYRNDILPRARGKAEQRIQESEGYKAQIVAEAEGNASRFLAVYDKYKIAKDVTRERMYLETMEEVLSGTDKILLDQSGNGNGVVPYLPLNELRKK
jgi:membrane protease subunit HflK